MPKLRKYDKVKLKEAVRDIQNGTESYRTAEKKYGIPKSTIEFKLKHPEHKDTLGPPPILTCEEEITLMDKTLPQKVFQKKANDFKTSVQRFLTQNPRPNKFKNNRPGDGWLKGFLKRHPEVSKRTSEGVTAASACVSERDIQNWFTNIESCIKEKHLEEVLKDPSRIFNGDESGFQICPSTGKVFAMKGSKNVYSVEKSCSEENVTVMFTFSADGKICVPMIIYPYQRIPEKVAKGVNPKWGVGRSDNGWMTAETFYQYIANVFYPHITENNIQLPVILFVDGHKSHLSYQLSMLCNELQIEIIALYPNATRILQPCDVSIFRPVKEAWRQSVREWEEQHPEEVVNRIVFASILEQTMKKSFKTETVVNGFKACGLFPFKADAIDFTKCLGKELAQDFTIPEPQQQPKMNYTTLVNILGPEKIQSLKNIKENPTNNLGNDGNLSLLYKVWNFFDDLKHSENSKVVKNQETTIHILQNIVITSPVKNIQIETEQSGIGNIDISLQPSTNNIPNQQNSTNVYDIPSTSKIIVKHNLLGSFLTSPSAPERKGKRNIERLPFAITSERYQEMLRKKQELKEEQEKQKQERKLKKEEKLNKNLSSKKKNSKQKIQCCICLKDIQSNKLRCDDCNHHFHEGCIPVNHKQHIPSDGDLFICHNCYTLKDSDSDGNYDEDIEDDDIDELFTLYNESQKQL